MDNQSKVTYQPDYAVSPGEVLEDELAARSLTPNEFLSRSGLVADELTSILRASCPVTPEIALKLERALGSPSVFWLNLERNYQEALCRIARVETAGGLN